MKSKETAYKKYKYNRELICENPDTALEHLGEVVEYSILFSQHNLGYDAGYQWKFKQPAFGEAVMSSYRMPGRNSAFSKIDDALYEAAKNCYDILFAKAKKFKGSAFSADLKPLVDFFNSLAKEQVTTISNPPKNDTAMAPTKSLIEKDVQKSPLRPILSKVQDISMNLITANKTNPRKTFKDEDIRELADSMQPPVGLLHPLTLRPMADGYEIVFGEQRYRAALLLNWKVIPAIVVNISDEKMLELQMIEMLQRHDVSPLDEAHGFKEMLQKENIDWLATRVHKPKKYITDRLKLNDLVPEAEAHVNSGALPLGHAMMISKLPYADQKACLAKCLQLELNTGSTKYYCTSSLESLRFFIESSLMLDFKHVSFDTTDPLLFEPAGACTVCPKRTSNNNLLFNDITGDDKCTDPGCFREKVQLNVEREKKVNKEKYGTVLSGETNYMAGSNAIKVQGLTVPFQNKASKHSIPVVITKDSTSHPEKIGTTVYVDKNKVELVKIEKAEAKKSNASGKTETYEQKRLTHLTGNWPRLDFVLANLAPVPMLIKEYFRIEFDRMADTILYGFAGAANILQDIKTPQQAIAKMELDEAADDYFKTKRALIDKVIARYTTIELIMILIMLRELNNDSEDVNPDEDYGFSWAQLLDEISLNLKSLVKKEKKPKKQIA